MAKLVDKNKTIQLLKEYLGWESQFECRNGFWLNDYTFIKADDSQLMYVERKKLIELSTPIEKAPMLILKNVVEMTVGRDGKILGVENKDKLGLWLDALSEIIKERGKQKRIVPAKDSV